MGEVLWALIKPPNRAIERVWSVAESGLRLQENEGTGWPGVPVDDIDWSCCCCLRENPLQGRPLCFLSASYWQRAAATSVTGSFTNQSSHSSTKHKGALHVYSPKQQQQNKKHAQASLRDYLSFPHAITPLPLQPLKKTPPPASVYLNACFCLSFPTPSSISYHLMASTASLMFFLLRNTDRGGAYLHNHSMKTQTI